MPDLMPAFTYPAPHQQLAQGPDGPMPLLSIAIPTFRRFDLLRQAVDSALALRFSIPVEILVVDNDPDSETAARAFLQHYPAGSFHYYQNQQNLGMYGNWNQCLALACGRHLTLLHDDDLLLPAFAEYASHWLPTAGDQALVGFTVDLLDERVQRIANPLALAPASSATPPVQQRRGVVDLFFANLFTGTLGVLIPREAAIALRGFNPQLYPIADYDFWCRWSARFGSIVRVLHPVGLYRLQQNESLRTDVQQGFVDQSRLLRQRLLDDAAVPSGLRWLAGIATWAQRQSIRIDWHQAGQPDSWLFQVVLRRIWYRLATLLGSLYR